MFDRAMFSDSVLSQLKLKCLLLLTLAILATYASPVRSFETEQPGRWFENTPENSSVEEILLEGLIDQATADAVIAKIISNPQLKVIGLNSPGGMVAPALKIARAVNEAGLNTSVSAGSECHSACSIVFLAGRERVANGLLGVHQISGVNDPSLTQTVISQIYEDLVKFNTPSYLISRMLRTAPSEMYVFTPEELEFHDINIRDVTNGETVSSLLPLETWTRQDWLVGVFMNTTINKPFVALESRDMDPLMRIVHYPHRAHTFVEFILQDEEVSGTTTQLELRFEHGDDEPYSFNVDADIETNLYAFDMPKDPDNAIFFWAAFSAATDLTVLNGYGAVIGRYSLKGSGRALEDFRAASAR